MEPFHLIKDQFHKVLNVNESDISWEDLHSQIPYFPKGWFELARLPTKDRIELLQAFWLAKLEPCQPSSFVVYKVQHFFSKLQDIIVLATQFTSQSAYEIHMIYEGEGVYFYGHPGALQEEVEILKMRFLPMHLPEDYLAFLLIHNGFSQFTDVGIISTFEIAKTHAVFEHSFEKKWLLIGHHLLSKEHLFPFYAAHDYLSYQCFFIPWDPLDKEIHNISIAIEDQHALDSTVGAASKYASFLEWLVFYLHPKPPGAHE